MMLRPWLTGAFIYLAAIASVYASDTLDRHYAHELFGVWTTDHSHPDASEAMAQNMGITGTITYFGNGTGTTILNKGNLCGPIVRQNNFSWRVKRGILIIFSQFKTLNDKILSITSRKAVLLDLDDANQAKEFREKSQGCKVS